VDDQRSCIMRKRKGLKECLSKAGNKGTREGIEKKTITSKAMRDNKGKTIDKKEME